MSFSSLINSLWNSKSIINKNNGHKNNGHTSNMNKPLSHSSQDIYSQGNINNSVPISQGKEYILYKKSKEKSVNNEINNFIGNDYQNSYQNSNSNYRGSNYTGSDYTESISSFTGPSYKGSNTSFTGPSYRGGIESFTGPKSGYREGFDGMLNRTQANTKNDTDAANLQTMESNFNQAISDYEASQQNLMDKTQTFLEGNRTYGTNIHAVQGSYTSGIMPGWVGCYKSGNDGLTEQADLGTNTNVTNCKERASDLGYTAFALRQQGTTPGNTCFVGDSIDQAQSQGLAIKSFVSFAFKKAEGTNIGGLLMNGQVGMYQDIITNNLVTDLTAVANCDISIGGRINMNTSTATYGYNCNGTAQSPFTPPPPPPTPPAQPTPDGYTKYTGMDSGGNDIIKMADGTSLADLATACNNNASCAGFNSGGWVKAIISPQNQWAVPSLNYNGSLLDLYVKNKPAQDTPSGYTKYPTMDSGGNDIIQMTNGTPIADLATACNNNATCSGFNSWGWLKKTISPQNQWDSPVDGNGNHIDLYVKNKTDYCAQYSDTDINISLDCVNQIWKEVGCTVASPPQASINWYTEPVTTLWPMTKGSIKADMEVMANGKYSQCFAPVPVVQTGSTVNNASLWAKPWLSINDGTWANSLAVLNDGTLICTNGGGYIFTRANLSSGWIQISQPTGSTISTQNGKCIDQSNGNQSPYLQMQLWDCGPGNPNQQISYNSSTQAITTPGGLCFDVLGSGTADGTAVIQYPCHGGPNQSWVYGADQTLRPQNAPDKCLDFTSFVNGEPLAIYNCANRGSLTWQINQSVLMKGIIQALDGTFIGVGQDNNLYIKSSLTAAWTGPTVYGLMSVIQMSDGTFVGVALNNTLCKSPDVTSGIPWEPITCPQSCCVTFISKLNDGTLVCLGLNGWVYTRQLDTAWVLVDGSMTMSSVTQLKDGTILGTSQAGWFFRK